MPSQSKRSSTNVRARRAMADAIVRLLRDPATSAAIAHRARTFVEERFDWDGIAARLVTTYEAALQERQ